ncbi:MAG: hypothetical protein ABIJ05_00080 [Patescibacteria group bacterium]
MREVEQRITPDLPFKLGTQEELINSFTNLESNMSVENVSMADWLKSVKGGEKWTISPETSFMQNLANLYLAEKEDSLVIEPIKNKAEENWEKYFKREEKAYKKLVLEITQNEVRFDDTINSLSKDLSLNKTDKRRLGKIWKLVVFDNKKEQFEGKVLQSLKERKENYLERSQNIQRKKLIKNSLNGLIDEIPKSSAKIGRADGGFFDVALKSITLIDKGINYKAPLMTEEPGYKESYREKHPIGIIILPYHISEDGKYYVYVSPRNEPGALKQTVLVAGEQTSLSKMTGQDILKQPGGPVLAVCAQEFGNINCDGVADLKEVVPQISHIIAYGNTVRMGGGFKVYATVKIEKGSSLFERYNGKWFELSDVSKTLENTKNSKPMINELLGNCLFVLQTERVEILENKIKFLEEKFASR